MVGKERTFGRVVPEGAYVTAMGILKRIFLDEATGVGDAAFWEEILSKPIDRKYTPKQACFQYYLAGYTHIEMARALLDTIPRFRTMRLSGDLTKGTVENFVVLTANNFLEYFPPKYRKKVIK